jgi:chromosome segregation ATPase
VPQEELLTNTLQRKLTQVRAEKESVEAQLEGELRSLAEVREQLERKVSELQAEKESFEAYVEHDLDGLLARLQEGLNRLTAGEGHADSQEEIHLLRSIMKQICGLRERVARQSRSHSFA